MNVIPAAVTRARVLAGLPLSVALSCVALVATGGWVWSFEEQTRWATSLGFTTPQLLPLVLDGLALSLAGVAFAAALDGRPAVMARIGTLVAVLSSSASNGAAAWSRTAGDPLTVTVAAAVPVAANLAFEVFLGELRRQVQRKRGMPAPVAIPWPRLVRLALAPIHTFKAWKKVVLELTEMSLTDRSVTDLTDPTDTSATGEGSSPPETTDPAAEATTTDPIKSTPRPPAESSVGSAAKPDPILAGKPAGSAPTRSGAAVNPTAPNGPGGNARSKGGRSDRTDDDLRIELARLIKDGHLQPAPSAEAIRTALRISPVTARMLRDEIKAAKETTATDGAEESEVAHG